jgi:hypothetical protein
VTERLPEISQQIEQGIRLAEDDWTAMQNVIAEALEEFIGEE